MTHGYAMQLAKPGHFERVDLPVPEPGPGEVAVKLQGCGVCASNVPPWEGRDWFTYPMEPGAPGHEAWGVIDRVGADVADVADLGGLQPGQRVATLSQNAYASHALAPADQVVPLPPSLDGVDFPGEPLACAMNVLERSKVRRGDTVLIVGVGFLGSLLVQLCAVAGAEVTATSRRASARPAAGVAGATTYWTTDEAEAVAAEVGGFFDGGRFDVVIEVTGKQAPLDLATKLVKEMGRLVVAGFHQDGPRTVDMQLWNWRGLDVINAHEREPHRYTQGLRRAVDAVVQKQLNLNPLITHRLPLSHLDEALALTRDRPEGFMKAVVLMDTPGGGPA